jgi:hypothetical protein
MARPLDFGNRVVAFPVLTKRKSIEICEAFLEGVPVKPGVRGSVFYGVTDFNMVDWSVARGHVAGRPFYYIDNSYFDHTRGVYYRVSKNSLQFKGPSYESDGKRWEALGYELKPWRDPGQGHIVMCRQSDTFMRYSLGGGPSGTSGPGKMWFPETMDLLKKTWPGREIRVREWVSDKPTQAKTLHEDLQGAGLLVTHSSAAAIEAVIEGVTVNVSTVSALAGMQIGSHNPLDQRLQYLRALADNQWTLDEIRNGDAWRWLNR